MRWWLLERFQKRVGGLIVGAVYMVDQEDAPAAMMRQELRALLEESRLRDGDLAQRTIGRERHEIGMGGKEQRIVIALLRGPLLALADDGKVVGKAQVVLLDFFGVPQQARAQPAGQGGFAGALGSGEEQRLRQPVLRDHLFEGVGDMPVAPEILKHTGSRSPTQPVRWCRGQRARPQF